MIRDDSDSFWNSWLPPPPITITTTTTPQPAPMFLNSASVSLVVARCVILPWRWEVQMEAVVDMTPRLRIPSSSRRKQRSLSPSHPLPIPPAKMCPHLMISVPVQTPTSSPHLPKWPLTSPKMPHSPVCVWNKGRSSHTHFLPHCASVQPPTGAGGEEALDHSLTELGRWCQAGVQRGTSPLGFSEARQARGVLQVQDK